MNLPFANGSAKKVSIVTFQRLIFLTGLVKAHGRKNQIDRKTRINCGKSNADTRKTALRHRCGNPGKSLAG
jgi:uncharacterized membrane protein